MHNDLRFFCRLARALNTHVLDRVVRVAEAGGVNESEQDAVKDERVFHRVAGCTLYITHDRALLTEQRIEQRRFADIRCAYDRDRDTVTDGIAGAEGRDQGCQFGGYLCR